MSQGNEAKGLKDRFTKSLKKTPQYGGASRRATSLLPELDDDQGKPMPVDEYINRQRLLLSLEANQKTCCIKFSSEKCKSRGAILVLQGRVLGAMYGVVSLPHKLYQQEAYAYAVQDLVDPETKVTATLLSEPLAVAAGALFHGQFNQVQTQNEWNYTFGDCLGRLLDSKLPGCVLVNDNENVALLSAYVFGGKIIALYSGCDGWLPATPELAFQKVAQLRNARVSGTALRVNNMEDVLSLTFSLSGLADRDSQDHCQPIKQAASGCSVRLEDIEHLKKKNKKQQSLIGPKEHDPLAERELFLRQHIRHLVDPLA